MNIVRMVRNGVPFYACPSWSGTAGGFSTRLGGVSGAPFNCLNLGANRGDVREKVAENYRIFCAAVGTDPECIVRNKQVHGSFVRPVTAKDREDPSVPARIEADGLVTNCPGVCLTVFSADCIPILFYDPVTPCVAAVHAGWRGTAAGIAAKAVRAMVEQYGCRAEHIQAAIGPGIGPCCFETHRDVADGLRAGLGSAAEEFIRPVTDRAGKFQVDLKGANRRWLLSAGLTPEQIAVCPLCTGCHQEEFWSHRMVGNDRGSMAAMIELL